MSISNIERLQNVADGFDELNEKITYVGGAVTGLYPNGAAASSHQTMNEMWPYLIIRSISHTYLLK